MTAPSDAVALAQALIRCPSVTPEDAGAIGVVVAALEPLGFACQRLRFENVENLYARFGTARPNFCFAGHTDVVPAGDYASWRQDPFAAEVKDGVLYGRGAADMKGGIAAFIAAVANYLKAQGARNGSPGGSISLIISGDEEGPGINGTAKVLQWLKAKNEVLDHCLVGEPTANVRAGDVIKIGRRGSINFRVEVRGRQGHAAYPQHAVNPIPILAELARRLSALKLDAGSEHFEPTTLAFTSVDVGNPATNVTPAMARVAFNIRFNDLRTANNLVAQVEGIAKDVAGSMGGKISFEHSASAAPFLIQPGPYTELLAAAVMRVTGCAPQFSTGGGTSDARFIKEYCPVAELGLPGRTIHKCDENVAVADIDRLAQIYEAVLERYFASMSAK